MRLMDRGGSVEGADLELAVVVLLTVGTIQL